MNDPATLLRRLTRYFNTIPGLAFVALLVSTDGVRLEYGIDAATAHLYCRLWREADRLLSRVAPLLGAEGTTIDAPGVGPSARGCTLYVRNPSDLRWASWASSVVAPA